MFDKYFMSEGLSTFTCQLLFYESLQGWMELDAAVICRSFFALPRISKFGAALSQFTLIGFSADPKLTVSEVPLEVLERGRSHLGDQRGTTLGRWS